MTTSEILPAPPTEKPAIVAVSEVIAVQVLADDVRELAERRQRALPDLEWAWCVVIAELELAAKRRGARDDMAGERLEMLQHRRRSMTARRSA